MIPVEGWKVGQAYKRAILANWPRLQGRLSSPISVYKASGGGNIFDALKNAAPTDKVATLIPQFVDRRVTATRVSSVEDLQQVPFNYLLD